MVCFRCIVVNTLHKGNNKDDDDNDDNNNNNSNRRGYPLYDAKSNLLPEQFYKNCDDGNFAVVFKSFGREACFYIQAVGGTNT